MLGTVCVCLRVYVRRVRMIARVRLYLCVYLYTSDRVELDVFVLVHVACM